MIYKAARRRKSLLSRGGKKKKRSKSMNQISPKSNPLSDPLTLTYVQTETADFSQKDEAHTSDSVSGCKKI